MEFTALITFILVVAGLYFWRDSVKRVARYSEQIITVSTKEGELDLINRANTLADQLETLGDIRVEDLDRLFESKYKDQHSTPAKTKK